ncbi:MAG: hypothetical protein ACXWWU_07190 [Candidatus Limnocylindria bacterium]
MTRIGLVVLNAFVAFTAIYGAILVVPTIPLEWLKHGPFTDYTVPALALGILVGGSASLAAVLLLIRPWAGAMATIVAGVMIIGFELVEIGVVGFTLIEYDASQFQAWLQVIYLALGTLQGFFGYRMWRRLEPSIQRTSLAHQAR